MKAVSKAVNLLTRCLLCRGSGKVPTYDQVTDVLDRRGKSVACSSMTAFKTCGDCGGSGKAK